MLYLNELFPFLYQSTSTLIRATLTLKRRNSQKVENLKEGVFTLSVLNDLPNNLIKYCTRALQHPVYSL
jgi:hypothetical protein